MRYEVKHIFAFCAFGIRTCAGSNVFKQVFGKVFSLSVFNLPAQFHFQCFLFCSVMLQEEPIPRGVGPEVQEAIKQAFSNLIANLTTVIESRLSDFIKAGFGRGA